MIEKSCKVAGATVLLCFVMGEALDLASVRVEVAVDCDVKLERYSSYNFD